MVQNAKAKKLQDAILDEYLKTGTLDLWSLRELKKSSLGELDKDGDGKLSAEERIAELDSQLSRISDLEKEGIDPALYAQDKIDIEKQKLELKGEEPKSIKELAEESIAELRRLDKNNDWELTREEYGGINPLDLSMLDSGKGSEVG